MKQILKVVLGSATAVAVIIGFISFTNNQVAAVTQTVNSTGCITLTKILDIGSTDANSGGEVSQLQHFLQERGYFSYENQVGKYDILTKNAVAAFEKDTQMLADGIVGTETSLKIEEVSCVKTPQIVNFLLVNADTNAPIKIIGKSEVVDLKKVDASKINVIAITTASVKSVQFMIDNKNTLMENTAPFSIGGDTGNDIHEWGITLGKTYNISVVGYSSLNTTGTRSSTFSSSITFINTGITPTPTPTPVPTPTPTPTPTPGTYSVQVTTPSPIAPSGTVNIQWTSPAGANIIKDWISINAINATNQSYQNWK
ncbi:MAG: peptidoglycan-binding protein, partial [bacterium]|nr:peptidoglycan-binding protein [bacterium]